MDESECISSGGSSMTEDEDQRERTSEDCESNPIPPCFPMSMTDNDNLVEYYRETREEQFIHSSREDNKNRGFSHSNSISIDASQQDTFVIPSECLDLLEMKINEELQRVGQNDESVHNWDQLCIYRIPKNLLDSGDTDADTPHFFSLGPYQTKPRFRDMNEHKWRALQQMLKRTGHNVKRYLDPLRELLKRALACYERPLNLTHADSTPQNENNPSVEMMMLDGCFILEMLQGFSLGFETLGYSKCDPVFSVRGQLFSSIRRDMILLGNQIPLFVLSRLLGIQSGKSDYQNGLVAEYAFNFFEPLMPTDPNKSIVIIVDASRSARSSSDDDQAVTGLHLLDELRHNILKGVKSQPATPPHLPDDLSTTSEHQQLVHCVTDLLKAGVTFKKGNDGDKFWDVKFKNGVLTIPRIYIHDATNSLLFNLIVYEQCHLKCSNHITYYTILMDNLINSAHDVSYLRRKGIIEHWLGSDEEVANLFNRLCKEVAFDYSNSYLAPLTKALNVYYGHRRNTWLAILKRRYLDNPWTIISVVAAAVLVLLTTAQTFYTIYPYYKPAN